MGSTYVDTETSVVARTDDGGAFIDVGVALWTSEAFGTVAAVRAGSVGAAVRSTVAQLRTLIHVHLTKGAFEALYTVTLEASFQVYTSSAILTWVRVAIE